MSDEWKYISTFHLEPKIVKKTKNFRQWINIYYHIESFTQTVLLEYNEM